MSARKTLPMLPWWHPRRAGRQRRPWPLADLVAVSGLPEHVIFARLNTSGRDRENVRMFGLTDKQADRWACRLRLHPGMVWADWFTIFDINAALYVSVREGRDRRAVRIAERVAAFGQMEMAA